MSCLQHAMLLKLAGKVPHIKVCPPLACPQMVNTHGVKDDASKNFSQVLKTHQSSESGKQQSLKRPLSHHQCQ